jgi:hypothetical protein
MLAASLLLPVAASIAGPTAERPNADRLMRDVIAQLPSEPLSVSGTLLVRRQRGIPIATYNFQLESNWGANPPYAQYTISDAFGDTLERLKITHGATNSIHYFRGESLTPAKLHSMSSPIQRTDISWMDLSLSFLWWTGGKIIGEDSVLTIDCYIIIVNAPPGDTSQYKSVKLWISRKTHMLLQAEGLDTKGKTIRRLWVRSCKKIDKQWMIKTMEIQKYPAFHRTKLRVKTVKKRRASAKNAEQSQSTIPRTP